MCHSIFLYHTTRMHTGRHHMIDNNAVNANTMSQSAKHNQAYPGEWHVYIVFPRVVFCAAAW